MAFKLPHPHQEVSVKFMLTTDHQYYFKNELILWALATI